VPACVCSSLSWYSANVATNDSATAATLVDYANELLRIGEIADYENALNGVQIENDGRVTKIGAAVDASAHIIQTAVAENVDFLVVHHGMFWPGLRPITGSTRELLRLALSHNLTLYSAHVPLDVHPELGNNALLMRALRVEHAAAFFPWKNTLLGYRADVALTRAELLGRLRDALGGDAKMIDAGPDQIRSLGVITGGAGGEIFEVAKLGIDTFVTGEAPHWAAVAARELEINLIVAGHYATETLGVRALAEHLGGRFGLPHTFIDAPTGF
jgi:dinuclear metal center YbgI/SA1388 family protein